MSGRKNKATDPSRMPTNAVLILGLILFNIIIRFKSLYQNHKIVLAILTVMIVLFASMVYLIAKSHFTSTDTKNILFLVLTLVELLFFIFMLYAFNFGNI